MVPSCVVFHIRLLRARDVVNFAGQHERVAGGEDQRVEVNDQLPAPLHPPRTLRALDHTLNIGSRWDHDVAIHDHGKRGFGVNRVVLPRALGGDGVFQNHCNPRSRRQRVRLATW